MISRDHSLTLYYLQASALTLKNIYFYFLSNDTCVFMCNSECCAYKDRPPNLSNQTILSGVWYKFLLLILYKKINTIEFPLEKKKRS